jgi:sulfur-carrier protein
MSHEVPKVKVKIRFFTSLREIVDTKEETLMFPDDKKVTVDVVLEALSEKHGKAFTEYVFNGETGQPKGFLQFLVNGVSTQTLSGLETQLRDGDVLAILPPVGGG